MKKRIIMFLAAGMLAMSLAGCGENQIPEMTDEQMKAVGEYAAITLARYDAAHKSRLVDISLLGSTDPTPVSTPKPTPAGMDPVDDTPIVNAGSGTAQNPVTMEEVLELPEGLTVVYVGEELYKTYPGDEADFFAINATQGKQLLVLNFTIINASDTEQELDFLGMAPEYRITVNGSYSRRAMITMLENDMAMYRGSIPSMDSVSLALVIEVEDGDAENLSSISLNLKNASKTYTIQLL